MTTAGSKPIAFEFATATRIVFGAGKLCEVGAIAKELGNRALIVTGISASAVRRAEALLNILAASGVQAVSFQVEGEPTVDVVRSGTQYARAARCNLVIGFGGGSVIDAGKAIAALLTNPGDPLDYLEVIGKGKAISNPSAPCIAIPTTAGTGTEVTRNAVLGSHEHRVKVSMRSPYLLPRVAIVDPELTLGLPKEVTAYTGLDALTQLIEPFVCNRANPLADTICREGMRLAARSLHHAYEHGDDLAARTDMATASLFGGLALANAGLGAVHGFAAPLGGMFPAPHGAVCAVLLPHVMEVNVRASGRAQASDTLQRYQEIARILTGHAGATIQDGIRWVSETCQALQIPPLRAHGITVTDFDALIDKASVASSMKANPVVLTKEELREILQRAL